MEKDGPLDAENIAKIIKTAKRGKSHQKNIFKKEKKIYLQNLTEQRLLDVKS